MAGPPMLSLAMIRRTAAAIGEERYRTVLWNPPTLIFPDLFVWAEQAYGVSLIMDMLTYNRHPFIDTSSPESMLRDLAIIISQGVVRNFFIQNSCGKITLQDTMVQYAQA